MSIGEYASADGVLALGEREADVAEHSIPHASICFETIMRLYYLHHGYETPDGHMTHNLMMLAYKGLSQVNALTSAFTTTDAVSVTLQDAKSTLTLAQAGLFEQGRNYFLPRALFQLVEKEMSQEDKDLLHAHVALTPEDSETVQSRQRYISSQYPVRFNGQSVAPEGWADMHLGQAINEFMDVAANMATSASSRTSGSPSLD